MKISKRQLKRIIKEAMSEDLATAHDQISEDIEEMGYAFAEHDTAEIWVDDNARFYHGVYVDTRPHNDGSGVTKVKIEWPEWDYTDLG